MKGVTGSSYAVGDTGGISIHTPVKGVTTYRIEGYEVLEFQSTHP